MFKNGAVNRHHIYTVSYMSIMKHNTSNSVYAPPLNHARCLLASVSLDDIVKVMDVSHLADGSLANSILADVPEEYDVKSAEENFPVMYDESMNTVLTQELSRFNDLIKTIKSSLKDMERAILVEILMSAEMEDAMLSMMDGMIPGMWLKVSFPSLKPVGSYVKDLEK